MRLICVTSNQNAFITTTYLGWLAVNNRVHDFRYVLYGACFSTEKASAVLSCFGGDDGQNFHLHCTSICLSLHLFPELPGDVGIVFSIVHDNEFYMVAFANSLEGARLQKSLVRAVQFELTEITVISGLVRVCGTIPDAHFLKELANELVYLIGDICVMPMTCAQTNVSLMNRVALQIQEDLDFFNVNGVVHLRYISR
jgi:hypothetical protein